MGPPARHFRPRHNRAAGCLQKPTKSPTAADENHRKYLRSRPKTAMGMVITVQGSSHVALPRVTRPLHGDVGGCNFNLTLTECVHRPSGVRAQRSGAVHVPGVG